MSATEELRRMLDERGVEWGNVRNDGSESEYLTEWQFDDNESRAIAVEWAVGGGLSVEIHRYRFTPEQAVAATLGDVPCLPYFWTHDDMLHVELPRLPESISVRLPEQRDREVGSARTWQYTRDNGTCNMEYCDEWSGDELYPTEAYVCSACRYVTVDGKPNHCPNCGRKAVDE